MTQSKGADTLFPSDLIARLPAFKPPESTWLVWLLKSGDAAASRLKRQMELWYSHYPEHKRHDLRARLQDRNPRQHVAAFFELVMHEWCRERWGLPLVEEPSEPGQSRPDFRVPAASRFYLEVATVFRSAADEAQEQRSREVTKVVSDLALAFPVALWFRRAIGTAVDLPRFKETLLHWSMSEAPRRPRTPLRHEDEGLDVEIEALPGTLAVLGPVPCVLLPVQGRSGWEQARNRILDKVDQFRNAKAEGPYVVAVCHSAGPGTTEHLIEWDLYGRDQLVFSKSDPGAPMQYLRDRSGLLTPKRNGIHNTSISAVILCNRAWHDEELRYSLTVFHNPFAQHRLFRSTFSGLRQRIAVRHRDGSISMKWINKTAPPILLEG